MAVQRRQRPDTIPAPTWSQLQNLEQALRNERHASEEEREMMLARRQSLQQLLIQIAAVEGNGFAAEVLSLWMKQDG